MLAIGTGEQDVAVDEAHHGVNDGEPIERFSVVVIGGGQAGLAAGYDLSQRGIDFVILERGSRLGENWRPQWDPLRLYTPARYDGLPGLPFPREEGTYPTKDQMADYLEEYAERFGLPVRLGITVLALTKNERGQFVVECTGRRILADQVIVATASAPLIALTLLG
jgi:putative flavoprotein involved in K+ transport